ncbi:hypothetical protein KAH81_05645 [bacterium]|nr:hypothetical protein [bacterium]
MRVINLTYALLIISFAALAEYPAGYFYAIYESDTFCVKPVITDSIIESEWFDYASASLHTGLEVPFESHTFFFYNPLTGNIGYVIQHNIDVIGTADATCNFYLDSLPDSCTIAISDDPGEFRMTRYPQGQWHWWYNTDGGAFYIPRSEWQFSHRAIFGSTDPIKILYFVSGHIGEDRIFLDSVSVGIEYDLRVGHGFLQLIPIPDDSIFIDCVEPFTEKNIEIRMRNSTETIDTLFVYGAAHTDRLFRTNSVPVGAIPPGGAGSIRITFTGASPGLYIDTLWSDTNEPCGTNPIFIYVRVLPPAIGHIHVQDAEGIDMLRVIDSSYAISSGNGVLMISLPDNIGAADLVDTTETGASKVRIQTTYGIKAWRKETCSY